MSKSIFNINALKLPPNFFMIKNYKLETIADTV
jgi:hypothetical protein